MKRYTFLTVGCTLAAAFVFYSFKYVPFELQEPVTHEPVEKQPAPQSQSRTHISSVDTEKATIVKTERPVRQGPTYEEIREFIHTQEQFGLTKQDKLAAYQGYSDEVLKELVVQDDLIAAEIFLERGNTLQVRCERAKLVIKHGSLVMSPQYIAGCEEIAMKDALHDKNYKKAMSHYREALSWYELGIRLGDIYLVTPAALQFKNISGLNLTGNDLKIISDLARGKLDDINSYRSQSGLIPLEKKNFNFPSELLETDSKTRLWARQFLATR